jgi:hypothetical protein
MPAGRSPALALTVIGFGGIAGPVADDVQAVLITIGEQCYNGDRS